jgi:hypothetical protein
MNVNHRTARLNRRESGTYFVAGSDAHTFRHDLASIEAKGEVPVRNRVLLWGVLLIAGFLVGFVPQYLKAHRLSTEANARQQQLAACDVSRATAQLRDIGAMLYLEASRKNYGTAGEYSSRLFAQLPQVAQQVSDPATGTSLAEIGNWRDTITADLAKGDPAVLPVLQEMLEKLQQVRR